jgi:hypothetical protein
MHHHAIGCRLTIGAALSLLLGTACTEDKVTTPSRTHAPDDGFAGVSLAELPLLAAGCTITGGVMNVTVKDGESAYVALRPADSVVTVNGNIFTSSGSGGAGGAGGSAGAAGSAGAGGSTDTGKPCEIPTTGTININSDTGGAKLLGRAVILDYINGLFMKAPSATAPSIKVDFTLTGDNGSKNALKIRGSDAADSFAVGAGTAPVSALNINAAFGSGSGGSGGAGGSSGAGGRSGAGGSSGAGGAGGSGGSSSGLDAFPDVTFKNITSVVISAGGGDDRLDASGATAAGVGTSYPTAVSLFGNDGADTIIGGLGDDMIVGGANADVLSGCQGNDTYDMGAAPAGDDVIAEACAPGAEGTDTLDYSKRTGDLTVALSRTLTGTNSATDTGGTSGETGEAAHISDKIVNIKLGAGDDTITVPAMSAVVHKIKGGRGDDTFNGNGLQDTFDGEGGDDTCISATSIMDYSARTTAITATLCGSGCSATTDNNDGDQSATGSSHSGSGAATTAAGGLGISVLSAGSGFTTASVGNTITLSNCGTVTADNAAYPIIEYISATSVKIDVTAVSGFGADASCDFSEAHPDATTNTGTAAAVAAKQTTATVTGLTHTANMLYHALALTHSATSTGGGTGNSNDDGTYIVLKVISGTSVAIDNFSPTAGGTMFGGSVTAMDWVETGAEHDNVQCANILGGTSDDVITGDARANIIRGGTGNDTLNGGSGNDSLFGEAGNDNLYGGAGDDTLVGSDGTDLLVGGDGNDVLQGDAGNDTFTCDGKNVSTATSVGTAPGDSDFRVDYISTDTLGVTPTDCEF